MALEVRTGDCLAGMREMEPASVDSITTDPPYGLEFMGRGWDRVLPDPAIWAEAFRVAKSGAHLVAFGAPRLYHRLACQIEDAGWVLRDSLLWLFGSGFPKSHNLDGDRAGWGTALKPAYEPIILARKPLRGTVAANVTAFGTGALNIDGCRIGTELVASGNGSLGAAGIYGSMARDASSAGTVSGRWPANLLLGCACDGDHDPGCAVAMLDEQSGERPSCLAGRDLPGDTYTGRMHGRGDGPTYLSRKATGVQYGDTGGASRFFYTAKASREEREAGLSGERTNVNDGRATSIDNPYQRGDTQRLNTHPTVKPLDLMRWLVRLVTPPGGLVLDPFTGSGTTGAAAAIEGFRFLGFELDTGHAEIARTRIAHWHAVGIEERRQASLFEEPVEPSPLGLEVQDRQIGLFDGT